MVLFYNKPPYNEQFQAAFYVLNLVDIKINNFHDLLNQFFSGKSWID